MPATARIGSLVVGENRYDPRLPQAKYRTDSPDSRFGPPFRSEDGACAALEEICVTMRRKGGESRAEKR